MGYFVEAGDLTPKKPRKANTVKTKLPIPLWFVENHHFRD